MGKNVDLKMPFRKDSKEKLEATYCRKCLDKHILLFYDGNSFNICLQRKLNEKVNLTQINQIYQMQRLHNYAITSCQMVRTHTSRTSFKMAFNLSRLMS